MSLFAHDEKAAAAISFFNSLADEDRIRIVSNLNPDIFGRAQNHEDMEHLILLIQQDIAEYDTAAIVNRLKEMGLEEMWAGIFVANVKRDAPTARYLVTQLTKIGLENFEKAIVGVMDALWMKKMPYTEVTEMFGTDEDQINCITHIAEWYVQDVMMWDRNPATIESVMVENGLTPERTDTLLRAMEGRQKDWYRLFLFRHTVDNYRTIQEIKEQNAAMLEELRDMRALLKEQK